MQIAEQYSPDAQFVCGSSVFYWFRRKWICEETGILT